MKINTYLTFNGTCEEAFTFYKSVFGGEFSAISRFSEMPADVGIDVNEADAHRVLHVALPIGNDVLMGSDTPTSAMDALPGRNISVSLQPESEAEARRIFGALAEGGTVTMPLERAFWDALFGMCTDRFGINWMVNYDLAADA